MTGFSADVRTLRAPAKVNLGLRLLDVRDDGYHSLESVFAPIAICDEIEIQVSPGAFGIDLLLDEPTRGRLPGALADVSPGPDNLVVRAAGAFMKETASEGRVRIRLGKQIPAGAGLGGGSSDAAAVLLGLDGLFEREVASETLHALALGLGADVPFFLDPRPSLVRGIGEIIEPLPGFPALDLVLANPGISLATAEVYRAADALRGALTEPRPGSTMRAISRLRGETAALAPALGDLLINDLEPAARRLCPPVARLMKRLNEVGALGVSMSGSGATVFGVFESGDRANRAAEALRESESDACWIEVSQIIA